MSKLINKKEIYTTIIILISLLFFNRFSFAQTAPKALFTVDRKTGCGVMVVQFTDLSQNSPTNWAWEIYQSGSKDIIKSNLQNPIFTLRTTGVYNVSLTAFNKFGVNTLVKNSLLNLYKLPESKFSSDVTTGCNPLTVNFTDSSVAGGSIINNWYWNFGDGFYSTDKNPKHIFKTSGQFHVALEVSDKNNCESGSDSYTITVLDNPKSLFSFTQDRQCPLPITATFTNNSTGDISGYNWTTDGTPNTSTQTNPSFIYNSSVSQSVMLVTTGTNGCQDTMKKVNFLSSGNLNANFNVSSQKGCMPLAVNFINTSTGNANSWLLNFGDGGSSTQQNPNYTYKKSGIFTVILTIKNSDGCSSIKTKTNFITVNPNPVAQFSSISDTFSCTVPFQVQFNSTTPNIVAWSWGFGDGTPNDIVKKPTHIYTLNNKFSVSLKVTDNLGCSNTLVKSNYINTLRGKGAISATLKSGCVPLTTTFKDVGNSLVPITKRIWSFGDGGSSIVASPTYIYNDTGKFCVTLIAIDTNNCSDTSKICPYIMVGAPPVTNFTATKLSACHPFNASFQATAKNADKFVWNFGDGKIVTASSKITHVYNDTSGYMSVTLIASQNGCPDTVKKINYINVYPPVPRFNMINPINCDTPHTVTFINKSISANISVWNFGDGSPLLTSSKDTIKHTYLASGYHNVILKATNNSTKCSSQITQKVSTSHIKINFIQDTAVACKYNYINFQDKSSSSIPIKNYFWDFGDNQTSTNPFSGNVMHRYDATGLFTVKFVITDASNCEDSIIKINDVKILKLPNVDFYADTFRGCDNLAVKFHDLSTSDNQSSLVKWNWNFGDNSNSNLKNPTHSYDSVGNFTVVLKVTDSLGCLNSSAKVNYVRLTKQITPSFTLDTLINVFSKIICYSDSAHFLNLTQGYQLKYFWDFGDGSTLDTNKNPIHRFKNIDTTKNVKIILTAIDTNTCRSPFIGQLTISHPKAWFGSDSTSSECMYPLKIFNFKDSSSTDVNNWQWNFGDPASSMNNFSGLQNPSHSFRNTGKYDVTLIVQNNYSCIDTLDRKQYISINGPGGTFDFSPKTGCMCLSVAFKAQTVHTDRFKWIFGDGNSLTTFSDSILYVYCVDSDAVFKPSLLLETKLDADAVCRVLLNVNDSIVSFSSPDVYAGLDTTICSKDIATLNADKNVNWSYLWSNNKTTSSITVNPTSTTTYYVTATNLHHCTDVDTVVVNVNPLPSIVINNDTSVCRGVKLNISAGGGLHYQWKNIVGDTSQITVTPFVLTTYTVTATNGFTCSAKDSVVVSISDSLHPAILGNKLLCSGDSTELKVIGGGTKYLWESNSVTLSSLDSINTHALTIKTTYQVQISDTLGCSGRTQTIVNVNKLPIANAKAGLVDSVCEGHIISLFAGGGGNYSYSWSTIDINNKKQKIFVKPIANLTTYTVTVKDEDVNCTAKDSIVVKMNPNPVVQAGKDTAICEGVMTTLTAAGGADTIFRWIPTGDHTPKISVSPNQTTVYNVILYNKYMCSDTSSNIKITVHPAPLPPSISKVYICSNEAIKDATLEIKGSHTTYNYTWFKSESDTDSIHKGTSITVNNVSNDLNYYVETQDSIGCKSLTRGLGSIKMLNPPKPDFSWNPQKIWEQMEVQFNNNSVSVNSTALSYQWDFGLGKKEGVSMLENPMHIYTDSSIYHVQLIATDTYSCKDTIVQILIVIPLIKVWVPTAFTPNNDGPNDLLKVRGPMSKMNFEVFNQWGKCVYTYSSESQKTYDPNAGWDGKYKGVEQPEGNYVWRLSGTSIDGRDVQMQGVTLLIR